MAQTNPPFMSGVPAMRSDSARASSVPRSRKPAVPRRLEMNIDDFQITLADTPGDRSG